MDAARLGGVGAAEAEAERDAAEVERDAAEAEAEVGMAREAALARALRAEAEIEPLQRTMEAQCRELRQAEATQRQLVAEVEALRGRARAQEEEEMAHVARAGVEEVRALGEEVRALEEALAAARAEVERQSCGSRGSEIPPKSAPEMGIVARSNLAGSSSNAVRVLGPCS